MAGGSALRAITLDDKWTADDGPIFIDGVQALVRLPLMQRALDERAGLRTAGFITGYRGSPLGRFDDALAREAARLAKANVLFRPGVNEDLAATAIWGTQQIDAVSGATVDGVFGLWYGKGPGVDRSGDVFKHANFAGTHANGGVLVVVGDDHPGKSSTVAHQSEQALAASLIPTLYPSDLEEFFRFGLLGWALSRHSGLWVGFKCVNETVEQTATVDLPLGGFSPIAPPRRGGAVVNFVPGFRTPLDMEMAVRRYRLPAALDFIRANSLDRAIFSPRGHLGIIAAGKTFRDVIQALAMLGIDEARAAEIGLSLLKIGCIWPLEPTVVVDFAREQRELLFIEEKGALLEPQAAAHLYNLARRPRIVGKFDEAGRALLPSDVQLEPRQIAEVILERLRGLGIADRELEARHAALEPYVPHREPLRLRAPYFCSGCPHNRSTKLPEGSLAMAGIGCHAMAVYNRSDTLLPTHMGGEGLNWTGISPFTTTPHIFQNLGDGTYYHSGLLAIRAAIAAGSNITYKILYNDAVAMTGGQPIDGPLSVGAVARQVLAEGAVVCVIVSDKPETYGPGSDLPQGVEVHHRSRLDAVQRQLREVRGTSVLIFEQTCAAESRRRRKRGKAPDPQKRLFINDAVCEGCGDCSVKSTCVSLVPMETAWGTKRAIDQSSCNKDLSCVEGFCPSFVSVIGGSLRKPLPTALPDDAQAALPEPLVYDTGATAYRIMITGIGGTGVTTVGAVLGMAAHLEHKRASIYDMTGLAQKNGAVYSHLSISSNGVLTGTPRVGANEADLVLAFDVVAALSGDAAPAYSRHRTRVVANADVAPTARFQFDPAAKPDPEALQADIRARVGDGRAEFVNAASSAMAHFGDAVMANMLMLGFALQRGLLPVGLAALERAIQLNGVAVETNLRALRLGRVMAHCPTSVTLPAQVEHRSPLSLEELIADRAAFLTEYQDLALSQRYLTVVGRVRAAERQISSGRSLTEAVARSYSKLLAYKDEYEVGRLFSRPAFRDALCQQFEGRFKLRFNMSPPLLFRRDPDSGQLVKREFGMWVLPLFRLLSRMRRLRGTWADIFGYTAERRRERADILHYEALIDRLIGKLDEGNLELAVELAKLPLSIKGFGHVKDAARIRALSEAARLLADLNKDVTEASKDADRPVVRAEVTG